MKTGYYWVRIRGEWTIGFYGLEPFRPYTPINDICVETEVGKWVLFAHLGPELAGKIEEVGGRIMRYDQPVQANETGREPMKANGESISSLYQAGVEYEVKKGDTFFILQGVPYALSSEVEVKGESVAVKYSFAPLKRLK